MTVAWSLGLPSPFGSAARSMPAITLEKEPEPPASRTLYARMCASGATPGVAPMPAAVAATCVPWPWSSRGSASPLTKS